MVRVNGTSQDLGKLADRTVVYGSKNTFEGDHLLIFGHENKVKGSHCKITGHKNVVHGNSNSVDGHGNEMIGESNLAFGYYNKVIDTRPVAAAAAPPPTTTVPIPSRRRPRSPPIHLDPAFCPLRLPEAPSQTRSKRRRDTGYFPSPEYGFMPPRPRRAEAVPAISSFSELMTTRPRRAEAVPSSSSFSELMTRIYDAIGDLSPSSPFSPPSRRVFIPKRRRQGKKSPASSDDDNDTFNPLTLEGTARELPDNAPDGAGCLICLSNFRDVLSQPCGCVVYCIECARSAGAHETWRVCPHCNGDCTKLQKICMPEAFLSSPNLQLKDVSC